VDCPYFTRVPARIWIESEHAFAFAADAPAAEGHILVAPKVHVPRIDALPMAVRKDLWKLVCNVRGRLSAGMMPDGGLSIGFDETAEPAAIHVVPRRVEGWRGVATGLCKDRG
jgi:diadenosine tetraphosphate (Ap4A) HIT family hydrolase